MKQIFNPVNPDPITTTITDRLTRVMNEEADRLIGELVEDFRLRLINKKNIAIAELIRCIEIQSSTDFVDDVIKFNIILRPMK